MTQVSKVALKQETWDKIFDLFLDTVLRIKDKNKLNGFLQSVLTPTERIMVAKRLAATVLLAKGHEYDSIRRTLRLSPPTIAKMSFKLKYEGEELHPIIEDILRRQARDILGEELKGILDLPTKGSLKSPDRLKREHQRKVRIEEIKRRF